MNPWDYWKIMRYEMKIWDRWTVRRTQRGKDHFYEWTSEGNFIFVCNKTPILYPAWFRSSEENDTYPEQFLRANSIHDDKKQLKVYPKLNMCKQCRAIQVMEELSD